MSNISPLPRQETFRLTEILDTDGKGLPDNLFLPPVFRLLLTRSDSRYPKNGVKESVFVHFTVLGSHFFQTYPTGPSTMFLQKNHWFSSTLYRNSRSWGPFWFTLPRRTYLIVDFWCLCFRIETSRSSLSTNVPPSTKEGVVTEMTVHRGRRWF